MISKPFKANSGLTMRNSSNQLESIIGSTSKKGNGYVAFEPYVTNVIIGCDEFGGIMGMGLLIKIGM